MASRASSRAGGYAGSARHDAEIAAAAAGMSLDDWLSEATHASRRVAGGGDSVSRILSSLDRLGARIRTLTPPVEPAPPRQSEPVRDRRAENGDDVQRAIEQIARKRESERGAGRRDGFDRAPERERHSDRIPERAVDRENERELAEIGARVMALSRPQRGRPAVDDFADELREGIADLKALISDKLAASPGRSLETTFRSLVERIDDLRSAVDSPRAIADLVQRLADIRREIAAIPNEQQFDDLTRRLDLLAERVDRNQSDPRALGDFSRSLSDLATAVAALDQKGLVAGIERRLDDVAGTVQALEQRLSGKIDSMERWNDAAGRQTALMSQIAQRSEQLPRLAHELERQAASVEAMVRSADVLPRLSENIDAIRLSLDGDHERSRDELKSLLDRLDDLSRRLDDPQRTLPLTGDGGIERRLGDIVERLDRFGGSLDAAAIEALDARLARLGDGIVRELRGIDRPEGGGASVGPMLDALARIEAQLGDSVPPQRLADIEDRISALTRSLGGIDFATTKDIAALDRLVGELRGDVAALASRDPGRIEDEIRRLSDEIARTQAQPIDVAAFDKLAERLTHLVDRLEERPAEVSALADALEKLEATISGTLSVDAIADRVASAAERIGHRPAEFDGLETEIGRLADELRADAGRDRDLLVAIGETVQRLAEHQFGVVAPAAPAAPAAPTAPVAPSVAEPPTAGRPDTWQDIEKALATGFSRPADAPTVDVGDDEMPRIFGRKSASRPRGPLDVAEGPRDAEPTPERIEPAFDVDKPLEPGSGKPRRPVEEAAGTEAKTTEAQKPRGEASPRNGSGPRAGAVPSKADFIAAARRAAMAAGTEGPRAATARSAESDETSASEPSRVRSILTRHKRQFMMGVAAALLLAGLAQIGYTLLMRPTGEPVAAVSEPAPAAIAPAAPPSPPASATPTMTVPAVPEAPAVDTAPAAPSAPMSDTPATHDPVAPPPTPPGPVSSAGPNESPLAATTDTAAAGFSERPAAPPADTFAQANPAEDADGADPITTSATGAVGDGLPLPPNAIGPLALRQAAASGDPIAQYEVAARFAEGRGLAPDLGQAIEWYRRAADHGLAPAQYRLGSLYEKGQGIARDARQAAVLYAKAAAQGNAKAMHNLAVLNAEGGLGEPNYQMAAKFFQQAADFGVRDSQFNLGILFARGLGVPRDLASSYKWFALAANGGDGDAAKKRDDIAQALGKDDLARARLAVETWRAKPLDPAANDVIINNPAWTAAPDTTASVDPTRTVARVQEMLGRLGYDAGPADGLMGRKTRDAIAAFQKARGLPSTGEIDRSLIAALGEKAI